MTFVLSRGDLRRALILAAVALALPGVPAVKAPPMMPPAQVEAVMTPPVASPPVGLPPIEYDKPFTGPLTVLRPQSEAEVIVICGDVSPAGYRIACAIPDLAGASCVIVIREDAAIRAAGFNPEIVFRHEVGHCHGWGADHAGGR
jgi:hypothetical protein